MKRMGFVNGCLCLLLVLSAMPGALAQAPAISPARVKARKELGQLGVEYSKSSFVKQASEGDTIAVQLFLAAGMDPNVFDNGDNALLVAVRAGHLETVTVLLDGGADLRYGSVLTFAMRPDVLKLLLDRGADVKGESGETAFVWAIRLGQLDRVNLLLERGADVNAKDHNGSGKTALMMAVEAAVSTTANNAGKPAADKQRMDTVKLLVARKADVNGKDNEGKTALRIAAHNGAVDMVNFLLDHGADVNAADKDGSTALIDAIYGGYTDLVKMFLDKGADANARTGSRTALTIALERHKTDIVQLLVNAGARQ